MTTLDDFPVRPEYQLGESLASYAFRFRTANGHPEPTEFEHLVADLYSSSSLYSARSQERLTKVRELRKHIGSQCVLDGDWWRENSYTVFLYPCAASLRVCPLCILEFGFHPWVHELPLIAACAHHQVRLLRTCPRCSRGLQWKILRAGWQCKCGQPIVEMAALPASSTELLQAELVSSSIDVVLPTTFSVPQENMSMTKRHRIEGLYELMYRLHLLRRAVISAMRKTIDRAGRKWTTPRRYCGHHLWELRQAACWPSSFHQTMFRLLRRYFRTTDAILIPLDIRSAPIEVLLRSESSRDQWWSRDQIQQELTYVLDQFKAPLDTSINVLFNPRYSSKERESRIKCFQRWWARVGATIPQPTWMPAEGAKTIALPTGVPAREAMAVMVVARLIDAANRRAHPARYRELLLRCYRPRAGLPSILLLRGLVRDLLTLPLCELKSMCSTLDSIESTDRSR